MADGSCHPQPGDLIEIDRPGYQHWALYMGDGYVINVTPVDEGAPSLMVSTKSIFTRKAKAKKQLLKVVVGNDKWHVNNKYDRSRTPRPVKEIIRSAEEWIDREVPYDVLASNCEHFVTMLRYGEGVSGQAKNSLGRGHAISSAMASGLACVLSFLPGASVAPAVALAAGFLASISSSSFSLADSLICTKFMKKEKHTLQQRCC